MRARHEPASMAAQLGGLKSLGEVRRLKACVAEPFAAPTLSRYLADPAYRAQLDAERVAKQAQIAAGFEAHDRARQEAAWARDDGTLSFDSSAGEGRDDADMGEDFTDLHPAIHQHPN